MSSAANQVTYVCLKLVVVAVAAAALLEVALQLLQLPKRRVTPTLKAHTHTQRDRDTHGATSVVAHFRRSSAASLHPSLFTPPLLHCAILAAVCCFCSRCLRRLRCCCFCCSCCLPSTLGYFRSLQLTSPPTSRRLRRCRSLLTFAWRTPSKVGRETERGERTLRPLSWQRSRRRTSTFWRALEWLHRLWKGGQREGNGGRYKSYRDHMNMLKSFECIHTHSFYGNYSLTICMSHSLTHSLIMRIVDVVGAA